MWQWARQLLFKMSDCSEMCHTGRQTREKGGLPPLKAKITAPTFDNSQIYLPVKCH